MSDLRNSLSVAASAVGISLLLCSLPATSAQHESAASQSSADSSGAQQEPSEVAGAPRFGTAAERREEILVTARKTEERLQDVPISISAFTAEGLRNRNIQNAYDLAAFTPNFQLTTNLGRRLDSPSIRGQFGALNPSTDPNASFFVDGIYVDGTIGSTSLANVERVEVLRGPQSATFGRATFAGAVNYITRRATNEFEGQLNAKVGDDGERELGAWASGPLIADKLYFFAGASFEGWDGEWRNDLQDYDVVAGYSSTGYAETGAGTPYGQDFFGGYIWQENPQLASDPPCVVGESSNSGPGCAITAGDNSKVGGEETKIGTFKLTWDATDSLQFNLKYERAEAKDDHYVYLFVPPSENNCLHREGGGINFLTGAGTALDARAGSRSGGWICGAVTDRGYTPKLNIPHLERGVATQPPSAAGELITSSPAPFIGLREDRNRYLLEGLYDVGDYQITARYARNDRKSQYVRDLDRSYALGPVVTGLFESHRIEDAENDSIEVRINSPADKRMRWSLGYYWFERDVEYSQRDFNGFSRFVLGPQGSSGTINNAVFGSLQLDLNDAWTFAFEGRYAEEEASFESPTCDPATNPEGCANDTFYSFSPRASLTWAVNDDVTTYVQLAQGNKPGGFNYAYFDDDVDTGSDQFDSSHALIAEEKAKTWEWGIKGNYLDGAVQANLSVFYIDWTNQAINVSDCIPSQTVIPCETQLRVDNAGESEVKGLELEATWFATDRLSFTLGYGYTDSKLEDYVDDELGTLLCPEECYAVNPGTEVFTDASLALQAEFGNVAGKSAPRVPKHNVILSQSYQAPLQDQVEWFVRNDWLYESKKYGTVSNLNWAPSMWNWNFRVGLDAPAWSLALYVDNVTNEKSPIQIQDFPLFDFATGYLAPIMPDTLDPGIQVYQNAFDLLPRRSRNAGLVFSYRFGAMSL